MVVPSWSQVLTTVALISGTSVGAGILALASICQKPGFVPSLLALFGAWVLMVATSFLFAEVSCNVSKKTIGKAIEFGIIAMTDNILGKKASYFAGLIYLFIHYSLLIAYVAAAGNIISDILSLPKIVGPLSFSLIFGGIIAFGNDRIVQNMNNIFFVAVIVTFLCLISIGAPYVRVKNLGYHNFAVVGPIFPILMLALIFHNIIPSACAQLHYHATSIRLAIFIGSFIPFLMFVLWNSVILGMIDNYAAVANSDTVIDPLSLLGANIPPDARLLVKILSTVFSLSAIITSYIGFVMSLMDFYTDTFPLRPKKDGLLYAVALLPPTIIAMWNPSIFLSALDVTGTYGISLLFVALPALLALGLRHQMRYQLLPSFIAKYICISSKGSRINNVDTTDTDYCKVNNNISSLDDDIEMTDVSHNTDSTITNTTINSSNKHNIYAPLHVISPSSLVKSVTTKDNGRYFEDIDSQVIEEEEGSGMITDAESSDYDNINCSGSSHNSGNNCNTDNSSNIIDINEGYNDSIETGDSKLSSKYKKTQIDHNSNCDYNNNDFVDIRRVRSELTLIDVSNSSSDMTTCDDDDSSVMYVSYLPGGTAVLFAIIVVTVVIIFGKITVI